MQLDEELNTERLLILSLIGVGTILKIEDDTTKMGIYELIDCVDHHYIASGGGSRLINSLLLKADAYAKNKHGKAPILIQNDYIGYYKDGY